MSHPSLAWASRPAATPTVLVVDDDLVVREACALLLEDHGFHVVTAIDGTDGLEKFRQIKPAVVLTDIIMPEKEGIGLIRELRRESPTVKIVAMSGSGRFGDMEVIEIATKLGANLGLQKPFGDLQLVNAIRGLLEPTPAQAPAA
jgi:CheY-like chemotaxis protein